MKKTNNEQKILLELLKSPEKKYNANNISKIIDISSMGALKILKGLEKKEIVISEKIGKASFYKINFFNNYVLDYLEFALKTELENSSTFIKRWVNELRKINQAEMIILFGSALSTGEKANDIDVLFLVKPSNFRKLQTEIEMLNQLNDKKIHSIYQTKEDFKKNLIKKNKIILEAIKGIFVKGQKKFLNLLKDLK